MTEFSIFATILHRPLCWCENYSVNKRISDPYLEPIKGDAITYVY